MANPLASKSLMKVNDLKECDSLISFPLTTPQCFKLGQNTELLSSTAPAMPRIGYLNAANQLDSTDDAVNRVFVGALIVLQKFIEDLL